MPDVETAKGPSGARERIAIAAMLGAYSFVLVLLLGHKPLWLDEIWQQFGTKNVSFGAMVNYARNGAGGALLPHFFQWALLKALPYSVALSRLPALIFSVAACGCVWPLARKIGIEYPLWAVVLFMLVPIQFRYGLEGRPYSAGLFFACWALVVLLQLDDRPSLPRSIALMWICAGALYSQPFAIFFIVPTAVALVIGSEDWKKQGAYLFLPLAGSALLYLPWYLLANGRWSNGQSRSAIPLVFDARLPLRILKEYSGGGYVVGICLIVLLVIAMRRARTPASESEFGRHRKALFAGVVSGVLLVPVAEAGLHYFYAARHLLFGIPAIVVLAAGAFDGQRFFKPRIPLVVGCVVLIGSAVAIVQHETKPHENWKAASKYLMSLADEGYCIAPVASHDLEYFVFFEPGLLKAQCVGGSRRKLALAASPYTPIGMKTARVRNTIAAGFRETGEQMAGGFWTATFSPNTN